MLSVSEAGNFLNFWASEFGSGEVSSGDILARASPGLRVFFGRSSALCSYEVSRFLSVFPATQTCGFRLVSRVERGRTLWRVSPASFESPDCKRSLTGEQEPGAAGCGDAGGALVRSTAQAPENVCIDGFAPADYLASNLRKALRRQAEFLDLPLDPVDPRLNRLIAEVAYQTVNAVIHAQEKSLAMRRDDEHDRAMEALFEARQRHAEAEIERLSKGRDWAKADAEARPRHVAAQKPRAP